MTQTRVVAYCRVSTGKIEQSTSLVNQQEYFEDYCKDNDEYELYHIYPEDGVSGTKLVRPQFSEMLYDAGVDIEYVSNGEPHFIASDREPKFQRILTKDSSRFARNSEAMQAIEKLRQKGVYVDFVTIGISSEDVSSDVMLKILMAIDAQDSKNKSSNVRRGHRQGMKAEIPVIPGLSFGYEKINKYQLIELPEQANIVRAIFDLYVNHDMGIRGIVEECKNRGYKSKRGKALSKSTIALMLKNPIYKGTLVRGKHDFSTIGGKKVDMLQVNKEYLVHDNHVGIPVIIESEMWQKAQDIMVAKIGGRGLRGKRKSKSKYSYLLRCGKCGATYSANSDRGRKFYNCSTKREHGLSECNAYNINESEVDKQIDSYVRGMYKDYIDVEVNESITSLELLLELINKKMSEDKDIIKIAKFENQLSEVDKKIKRFSARI